MATRKTKSKSIQLLSEAHQVWIDLGAKHRSKLRDAIERSVNRTTKRHFYIFSPPGLGKTYTVEKVFEEKKITPITIKGNNSLFGFVVDMALIVSNRDPKKHIFLFIDDCDNLLLHNDSVNTLKIALRDGVLNYNKALTAQYNQLEEFEQDAIDQFRIQGRKGVSIPLGNVTIIWCSNYKLATQADTKSAKSSDAKHQKYIDEEALRRRLNARDYDMQRWEELWGWIADCVLNETPPSMKSATRDQLEHILFWMYSNWAKLTEHNISFAEKLYEEMELDPDSYTTAWEYDYLVN